LGSGFEFWGLGLRVGFVVSGLGFRVWRSAFRGMRFKGPGLRIWGFWGQDFDVLGFGCQVSEIWG